MERNASDILKQVKEFFNTLVNPVAPVAPVAPAAAPVAPVTMSTDYTLNDGVTMVSIDKLEAGGVVKIKDVSSAEVAAPAGEHTLQDGTVLVVAEGGIISEVKPIAPVAPAPMSIQQMEEFSKMQFAATIEDRIAALEKMNKALMQNCMGYELAKAAQADAVEAYRTSIEGIEVEMKAHKETSNKVLGGVIEVVEALSAQPTGTPDQIVVKKNHFKADAKEPSETIKNITKILFS